MNTIDQKKLARIDQRAARYSRTRSKLSRRYAEFQHRLHKLQEKYLPKIKAALDEAATDQGALEVALSCAPELFEDPRTLVLHGIRVGFMQGQAAVQYSNAKTELKKLVDAIRERFTAEEIATLKLINRVVLEVPNKEALLMICGAEPTARRAKTLPVEYTAAGDRPFIKPADHALDKVITKLLEEGLKPGSPAEAEEGREAA